MWNPSLPRFLTRYLLQQMRPASRASEDSCSNSSDTKWTEGELVNTGLLTSQVEDPDLGVGDTTIESALGIGLVLAVAIALGRSPTHLLL